MENKRKSKPALYLALAWLGCQGCAEVAPWERGVMAKDIMSLDPSPNLNHIRDHIFTSREAAQGGRSGSGGGCGCN